MMLTQERLTKFIDDYSPLYYYQQNPQKKGKEEKKLLETKIYCVHEMIEEIASNEIRIIDNGAGIIDEDELFEWSEDAWKSTAWKLVAWKAGKLEYDAEGSFIDTDEKKASPDGHYAWDKKNIRGTLIEKVIEYLELIQKKCQKLSGDLWNDRKNVSSRVKTVYEELLEMQRLHEAGRDDKKKNYYVKSFGPVYILNLIYFLSRGVFPIYDQFAHKAAKALYFNANPKNIFVGSPPDKSEIDKVLNMYGEYCWLLDKVFGTYSISRKLDRALWVYGHNQSDKRFCISDNDKVSPNEYKLFDL